MSRSLHGAVWCNCVWDSEQSPPIPREQVVVGYYGRLEPAESAQHMSERFEDWVTTICPHPDQSLVGGEFGLTIGESNFRGIERLRRTVDLVGWEFFPVLSRYLSEGTAPRIHKAHPVPVTDVAQMLVELSDFQTGADLGTMIDLVDRDTRQECGRVFLHHKLIEEGRTSGTRRTCVPTNRIGWTYGSSALRVTPTPARPEAAMSA